MKGRRESRQKDETLSCFPLYTLYRRADGTRWIGRTGPVLAPTEDLAIARGRAELVRNFSPTRVSRYRGWGDILGGDATKRPVEDRFDRWVGGDAGFRAFRNRPIPGQGANVTYGSRTGNHNKPIIHAHHIVPQKDASGTSSVKRAHLILRTVGIDPYFGRENLVWAPLWSKHSSGRTYRDEVLRRLETLGIPVNPNPTPLSVAAMASDRGRVARSLSVIGTAFFNATIPM